MIKKRVSKTPQEHELKMDRQDSFSLQLSHRIDQLIEGHLKKNHSIPRDMYIPGLDDGGKLGSARENEIFDLEPEGTDHSVKIKDFQAPHAKGEGTITGNVGSL